MDARKYRVSRVAVDGSGAHQYHYAHWWKAVAVYTRLLRRYSKDHITLTATYRVRGQETHKVIAEQFGGPMRGAPR